MATQLKGESGTQVFNVPNQLTTARLILAIVVFSLISFGSYLAALITFVVAASTDWVDGYWARRYGQVTKLGRIMDPFVDKIIICGTFICLAGEHALSGIGPWVAVVVMGRELLVTALRAAVEQSGGDFSAKWAGKWKMVFQCFAAGASLLVLVMGGVKVAPVWMTWTLSVCVWVAVLTTVYSGVEYVIAAARLFRRESLS